MATAPKNWLARPAFDLYPNSTELRQMLSKLRQDGVVREFEIAMKKEDGSIVPMDISISLLKNDKGRTIGSVCVARDLSRRKKHELELKRARDELSRYYPGPGTPGPGKNPGHHQYPSVYSRRCLH